MKTTGAIIGFIWALSPVFMGLGKLFGWAPFHEMSWVAITFTWWWTLLVCITTVLQAAVLQTQTEEKKEVSSNKNLH